jgi:hypothetical protein
VNHPIAKRYLVTPDVVQSKRDGQYHYIDAPRLMRLYGVDPAECIVAPTNRRGWNPPKGLIVLRPRHHGDYREFIARAALKGEDA